MITNENSSLFDFRGQDIQFFGTYENPWFVAKEVAQILGIQNHRDFVATLKPNQRGVDSIDTLGGPQEMTIISESALYKMISKSRKPEAELFMDWVFEDVLPSIRRKGKYELENKINELQQRNNELEQLRFLVNENDHIRPIERILEQQLISAVKYYELIHRPKITIDNKTYILDNKNKSKINGHLSQISRIMSKTKERLFGKKSDIRNNSERANYYSEEDYLQYGDNVIHNYLEKIPFDTWYE